MKRGYRILIACAVVIVSLFVCVALFLLIFDREMSKLAAVISLFAGALTFRSIKPGKAEMEAAAKTSHSYHDNGTIKEKGKLVAGRREGAWDFFDESGEFIETKNYKDGREI